MNERIKLLAQQAQAYADQQWLEAGYPSWENYQEVFAEDYNKKFAELIVRECTAALFDESERLSGLYSEEADMQQAERYELCSEQCTDNIALIEKHFGVEE